MIYNPYEFESPRVEELPEDFVQDIISKLNYWQEIIEVWQKKEKSPTTKYGEELARHAVDTYQQKIRSAKDFLAELGLHVVYDIPGHRNSYHIPTHEDCERWELWIEETCYDEEYSV